MTTVIVGGDAYNVSQTYSQAQAIIAAAGATDGVCTFDCAAGQGAVDLDFYGNPISPRGVGDPARVTTPGKVKCSAGAISSLIP